MRVFDTTIIIFLNININVTYFFKSTSIESSETNNFKFFVFAHLANLTTLSEFPEELIPIIKISPISASFLLGI